MEQSDHLRECHASLHTAHASLQTAHNSSQTLVDKYRKDALEHLVIVEQAKLEGGRCFLIGVGQLLLIGWLCSISYYFLACVFLCSLIFLMCQVVRWVGAFSRSWIETRSASERLSLPADEFDPSAVEFDPSDY